MFFLKTEGRSLFLFIREHCFAKKLWNISAFSFKFGINLSSCNNDGIEGIILLLKNVFNKDEYDFELVMGSDIFSNKQV